MDRQQELRLKLDIVEAQQRDTRANLKLLNQRLGELSTEAWGIRCDMIRDQREQEIEVKSIYNPSVNTYPLE